MRRFLSAALFLLTVSATSHATPVLFSYEIFAQSELGGVFHPRSFYAPALDLWVLTDTDSFVPRTYTPPNGPTRVLYTTTTDLTFVVGYGGVPEGVFTDAFSFRGIPGFGQGAAPPFEEDTLFDDTKNLTVFDRDGGSAFLEDDVPAGVLFPTTAGDFEIVPGMEEILIAAGVTEDPHFQVPGAAAPEPGSLLLLGTGAGAMATVLRRRVRR